MSNNFENPECSSTGTFIRSVQPQRDLQSNWTVDLAKNLEEYLLKICSGEISGTTDEALVSVNFAEAALLLQGSVQVYSRKVEYLYSLVLHALEFISQKSQEDQASTSSQPESSGARKAKDQEDDTFWGSDDISVEAKNLLDSSNGAPPSHFVRPPANLVVLEGECLDALSDAGELESYLLATNDLYRDFILLDSCDAVAVDNFLDSEAGKGPTSVYRASTLTSKGRKTFQSPSRLVGSNHKSAGKKQDANRVPSPCIDRNNEPNDCNLGSSPPDNVPEFDDHGFGMECGNSGPEDWDDSDDNGDPWKPLNPHEPGNLRVKPYKKVKSSRRLGIGCKNRLPVATEFPLAKLRGPISKELSEMWEAKFGAKGRQGGSETLSLYEKLRQSLTRGERKTNDTFCNLDENAEDNGYDSGDPDIGSQDFEMPDNSFDKEDIPPCQEKNHDSGDQFGTNDTFEDLDDSANLEDLCRSHLDSLLASLAETETQTELAARVSTWKQRIEHNLEEQEARPPFDIHKYGEKVIDKLSGEGDDGNALTFGDVVRGQQKHDVARTFSALLQLVNNGDVDLVRSSMNNTSTCYSNANPFRVRLLKNPRKKGILLQSAKKRPMSPLLKRNINAKSGKGKENLPSVYSSPPGSISNCRSSVKLGKASGARCTPDGKKRRKSRFVTPQDVDLA